MTIGYEVRSTRKARGLTMAQLAEAASAVPGAPDIGIDQIARIEAGRAEISLIPGEEPLVWVSIALGLSLGEMLGRALAIPAPMRYAPQPSVTSTTVRQLRYRVGLHSFAARFARSADDAESAFVARRLRTTVVHVTTRSECRSARETRCALRRQAASEMPRAGATRQCRRGNP